MKELVVFCHKENEVKDIENWIYMNNDEIVNSKVEPGLISIKKFSIVVTKNGWKSFKNNFPNIKKQIYCSF